MCEFCSGTIHTEHHGMLCQAQKLKSHFFDYYVKSTEVSRNKEPRKIEQTSLWTIRLYERLLIRVKCGCAIFAFCPRLENRYSVWFVELFSLTNRKLDSISYRCSQDTLLSPQICTVLSVCSQRPSCVSSSYNLAACLIIPSPHEMSACKSVNIDFLRTQLQIDKPQPE